jgi:hypothetical protein
VLNQNRSLGIAIQISIYYGLQKPKDYYGSVNENTEDVFNKEKVHISSVVN